MKAVTKSNIALLSAALMVALGAQEGARAGLLSGNKGPQQKDASNQPAAPDSPELQAAGARIDKAKTSLDQARRQLEAAKAVLKAANAEFNAARAEQEALSLRTQAQRLADSSGLQGAPMEPPVKSNRLLPAPSSAQPTADAQAATAGALPTSSTTDPTQQAAQDDTAMSSNAAGDAGEAAPAQSTASSGAPQLR